MVRKTIRSQRGFSLVELMIVVAIIGILAAVAIPNYQKFQRKARQSEAKTILSGYYTAMKASQAEYGLYPGNFVGINYQPDGTLNYDLVTTHNGAFTAGLPQFPGAQDDPTCISTGAAGVPTPCTAGTAAFNTWQVSTLAVACTTATSTYAPAAGSPVLFTACAGSNIGGLNPDFWELNQDKAFANSSSGL